MKIMSKNFHFFISCCKCIFWCWWARGVYGNVSRVLQTRKTTKFCTVFLIIHYNRDFNTNGHSLHLFHFGVIWSSWRARAPRELTSRQIKNFPNGKKKVGGHEVFSLAVEFRATRPITKQSNYRWEMCTDFNEMSKYQWFMTCLLEPNHV